MIADSAIELRLTWPAVQIAARITLPYRVVSQLTIALVT